MKTKVKDQAVREELLDISQSFIVQAPAGSGKTELLTQRILALLAVVEYPETILAITFTRKAAAEMRQRVVDALKASQEEKPNSKHELLRWNLAQQALKADRKYQWNLIANPNRLNIFTIDALSAKLAVAQPLDSQIGTLPEIEQRPENLYQQAAETCLNDLSEESELGENIRLLLQYKDNKLESVIALIAQLLAKRMQWLGRFDAASHSINCEQMLDALEKMRLQKLTQIYKLMPTHILVELPPLLEQVAGLFATQEKHQDDEICQLSNFDPIQSPTNDDVLLWKSIANLLLSKGKSSFYKSVTKTHGFPTVKDAKDAFEEQQFKTNKESIKSLLSDLQGAHELAHCLDDIRSIPTAFSESIYNPVLASVVKILPHAEAHLRLVFQSKNKTDFSQLSLAAINALGDANTPSDLALALDYKIGHILVDEFQDTSSPQIKLLELLLKGWTRDDGRSLFLVGDPMQSIYRFRDANVSLFLQIKEHGLAGVELMARELEVNFRSNKSIIGWVNQQFTEIMPKKDNYFLSAVSYTKSEAFNQDSGPSKVTVFASLKESDPDGHQQQSKIIEIIKQHLNKNNEISQNEQKTLAILVRSKSHVKEICRKLSRKEIAYQAVELVKLSDRILVQDVTRLALALSDPYDSISWLACFRAPWFALSINDLWVIERLFKSSHKDYPSCLQMLVEKNNGTQKLSDAGLIRAVQILPILCYALRQKARKPFRKWLLGTFKALGGFSPVTAASDYVDVETCVDTLSDYQQGGNFSDPKALFSALEDLYAAPDPSADRQVQIMTIHKSKGLEFDQVILPQIHRKSGRADTPLLRWTELSNVEVTDNEQVSKGLLPTSPKTVTKPTYIVALSKELGEQEDPLYQYIGRLEQQKSLFELQRLFYVAATRAKSVLYAFCHLELLQDDEKKKVDKNALTNKPPTTQLALANQYKAPVKGSFLSLLWPNLHSIELLNTEPCAGFIRNQPKTVRAETILESDLNAKIDPHDWQAQLAYLFPTRPLKVSNVNSATSLQSIDQDIEQYKNGFDGRYRLGDYALYTKQESMLKDEGDTSVRDFNKPPQRWIVAQQSYAAPKTTGKLDWRAAQTLNQSAAIIGKVIHAQLEWLSELKQLPQATPKKWQKITESQLLQAGIHRSDPLLKQYTSKVLTAIEKSLQDPNGRFILAAQIDAESELVLQSNVGDSIQTRIVDRCFIAGDKRWIIDYKSSQPNDDQTLAEFLLEQRQLYLKQIESYVELFRQKENRAVVAGLYFPLMPHLEIMIGEAT